jgi:hypothetical protein
MEDRESPVVDVDYVAGWILQKSDVMCARTASFCNRLKIESTFPH